MKRFLARFLSSPRRLILLSSGIFVLFAMSLGLEILNNKQKSTLKAYNAELQDIDNFAIAVQQRGQIVTSQHLDSARAILHKGVFQDSIALARWLEKIRIESQQRKIECEWTINPPTPVPQLQGRFLRFQVSFNAYPENGSYGDLVGFVKDLALDKDYQLELESVRVTGDSLGLYDAQLTLSGWMRQ